MSRRLAFIYHLGGTVLFLTLLSITVYFIWFPEPYGQGLGLKRQLLILWLLQIGAGPLLTLVLFKPGKPGLKFDVGFIVLVQVAALTLSMWMTYQARPVFMVFAVDRFEVMQPGDVNLDGVTDQAFASLPFSGPIYVVGELPTDPKENTELLFSAMDGGGDVQNYAKYYRPYTAPYVSGVTARAKPLSTLFDHDGVAREMVLTRFGADLDIDRLLYLPVMIREDVMSAVIDPVDGRVLGVVPVSP